jgi:hypothetical protein
MLPITLEALPRALVPKKLNGTAKNQTHRLVPHGDYRARADG